VLATSFDNGLRTTESSEIKSKIFQNSLLYDSLVVVGGGAVSYMKCKALQFIQNNEYCFSLQLPNFIIDKITRNPEMPWNRVFDGFTQDLFSRVSDLTRINMEIVVTYGLSELALIPLHGVTKAIQETALKRFFPDPNSLGAIAMRVAFSSLVIGLANYHSALDWDTRHQENYLNDLSTNVFTENLVCIHQSSLDARVLSAFVGAVTHGITYEVCNSFIVSFPIHAVLNIVAVLNAYGTQDESDFFVRY